MDNKTPNLKSDELKNTTGISFLTGGGGSGFREKIIKKIPLKIIIITILYIAFLSGISYFMAQKRIDFIVGDENVKKQTAITQAQAGNLVSFFEMFGDTLVSRAQLINVEERNEFLKGDMDAFVNQWAQNGFVTGVSLMNDQGVVEYNSNILGTSDTGESFAERDYFIWSKNQESGGEYYIGEHVTGKLEAARGVTIIPIASPIFNDGNFSGVLVAAVKLDALTKHYLDLMKTSDQVETFLIKEDGEFLYNDSQPELVGKTLSEYLRDNPDYADESFLEVVGNVLSSKEEGNFEATFKDNKSEKTMEHIVTYKPINMSDKVWYLILTIPRTDFRESFLPLKYRIELLFLLVSVSIVFYGYLIFRENR